MSKFKTVANRIEELTDPEVEVRRKAAKKLGEMGDRAAVPFLCRALQDEDPHVRNSAAWALGSLQDPAAFEPLREAVKDKREGLRRAAAYALGQIGKHNPELTPQIVEVIMQVVGKAKRADRWRYVEALIGMELTCVAALCIEYNSHRNEARQTCAQETLVALEQRSRLGVFAHLLADTTVTPAQKWTTLEMLTQARPARLFSFRSKPDARHYCEMAAAAPNGSEDVQRGAKAILEYLSLGRASQESNTQASAELLRMASGDEHPHEDGSSLLRGAQFQSVQSPPPTYFRGTIIGKIRRFFGLS